MADNRSSNPESFNIRAARLRHLAAQPVFNSSVFAILGDLRQALLDAADEIDRLESTEKATYRAAEREYHRLRELLKHWSHESHLQTFEDRERFRAAVRAELNGEPT